MVSLNYERRALSEGLFIEETGADRMQVHLAAAALNLGRYDSVTHLLRFSEREADLLATELGVTRKPRAPLDFAAPAPRDE
jgi:hypothetical protein